MLVEISKKTCQTTATNCNGSRTRIFRKNSSLDIDENFDGAYRQRTVKGAEVNHVGRKGVNRSNSVERKISSPRYDFVINDNRKAVMGGGMTLKRANSAERNRNEKLLSCLDSATRISDRSVFYKMFEFVSQIGKGNFSNVFLVFNSEKGQKYAVKEIDKVRMRDKLHFVENEIALLRRCPHRNICRLVDAFECRQMYFLVFDYAQKGDLFETVRRVGRLPEHSCALVTRQIASALAFLHRRRIVHRDVKPENILLGDDSTAKLTDFGLACVLVGPLYRVCGTPTYVAPEILTQKGYSVGVDIWSLGIILHICLVGFAPFSNSERPKLFRQIVDGKISFDHPNWNFVGTKAKRLLLGMLTVVTKRLDADQVTRNDWINEMMTRDTQEVASFLRRQGNLYLT